MESMDTLTAARWVLEHRAVLDCSGEVARVRWAGADGTTMESSHTSYLEAVRLAASGIGSPPAPEPELERYKAWVRELGGESTYVAEREVLERIARLAGLARDYYGPNRQAWPTWFESMHDAGAELRSIRDRRTKG